MKNSKIEWTDHTFNPWIGCTKVSPGCAHCYAEAIELRYGADLWGKGKPRKKTSDKYWAEPLKWNKAAAESGTRPRVFCASMCDVFDQEVLDEWRSELFELIEATPHLDWLILTKRPEAIDVPLPASVWLGTSVEDQTRAQERIEPLLSIPVRIHFLSVEPLLGPLCITDALPSGSYWEGLDWIIVGGESGPQARPMSLKWVTNIARECREQGWAFFLKQLGGYPNKRHQLEDFPPELRIREFPD